MKKKTRLPADEVRFLATLPRDVFQSRLRALWKVGWSLKIIADSIEPKKPKSTVHFWVQNAQDEPQSRPVPPTPPKSLTSTAPLEKVPRTRSISPSVPPDIKPRLKELSSLSRLYRAKTPPTSPLALANREFTDLCKVLYNRGVPAASIAEAAGVTYRAVARRLSDG